MFEAGLPACSTPFAAGRFPATATRRQCGEILPHDQATVRNHTTVPGDSQHDSLAATDAAGDRRHRAAGPPRRASSSSSRSWITLSASLEHTLQQCLLHGAPSNSPLSYGAFCHSHDLVLAQKRHWKRHVFLAMAKDGLVISLDHPVRPVSPSVAPLQPIGPQALAHCWSPGAGQVPDIGIDLRHNRKSRNP